MIHKSCCHLNEASDRVYNPASINALLGHLRPQQRSLLWDLYRSSRNRLTVNERAMQRELLGLFRQAANDVERDIGNAFAKLGTDQWSLSAARRIGYDRVLFAQIEDRVRALGGELHSAFDKGLLDQYKTTYVDAAHRLDVLTPGSAKVQFGLLPDREIVAMLGEPWSGARFSDRLGLITSEAAANIKHSLIRSMMGEESWQQAARRIRDEMGTTGQRSVWRAEMIARTELSHAQELANTQVYDANDDVIDDVVWLAHPGACDVCTSKHGQPVSRVGVPPDDSHPNCLCDQLAIPKSWGALARAGDGDFRIRPVSRVTWAAQRGVEVAT